MLPCLAPPGVSAGVGFAIPIDTVKRVVPQLIAGGSVVRPSLGVQVSPPPWGAARRWWLHCDVCWPSTEGRLLPGSHTLGCCWQPHAGLLLPCVLARRWPPRQLPRS
jgi:hypothetical protein